MSQKQDINAEKIIASTMDGLLRTSVVIAIIGLVALYMREVDLLVNLAVFFLLISPLCVSAVATVIFAMKKEKGMAFVSVALCLILTVTVAVRYGLAN